MAASCDATSPAPIRRSTTAIDLIATSTIANEASTGDLILAGPITGNGDLNYATTLGGILVDGDNSYVGLTTIEAGTVTARHSHALGIAAAGSVVNQGGTLNVEQVIAEPITLNGGTVAVSPAITSVGHVKFETGVLRLPTNGNSLHQSRWRIPAGRR